MCYAFFLLAAAAFPNPSKHPHSLCSSGTLCEQCRNSPTVIPQQRETLKGLSYYFYIYVNNSKTNSPIAIKFLQYIFYTYTFNFSLKKTESKICEEIGQNQCIDPLDVNNTDFSN